MGSDADDHEYHTPVLLQECIDGLHIDPEGTYVDVTFGGGGHSREILRQIRGGRLLAFDQDPDARENADRITDRSFTFIEANFRFLKKYLKLHGVRGVDGILADLGISSHQIDQPQRGFSTRYQADLDMRMDTTAGLTAREILNTYHEKDLHRIFGMYGEVRNARTLASAIVAERINQDIRTVDDLKKVLSRYVRRGKENRYYAQVFQALRIEVNQELEALEEFLQQTADVINPGGRLVIMSYHSLEDRLVKNFIQNGNFRGQPDKDFFGNLIRPFTPVTRKPVLASEEEIKRNNRARSAKLRIAEKNKDGD